MDLKILKLKKLTINIEFPLKNEYPIYAELYMKFVNKEGSLIQQLKSSLEQTKPLIDSCQSHTLFINKKDQPMSSPLWYGADNNSRKNA